MRQRALDLSGYLNALEAILPKNEVTCQAFTNARQSVGFIHAQCTQIENNLKAARLAGQIESETTARDLELHPKQLPPQVPNEKLLASLHRAGDHTQDPTDNEATDRAGAISGKEAAHGA